MLSSCRHSYLSLMVIIEGPWCELGVADELWLWYVFLSHYCTRSSCSIVSLKGLFCSFNHTVCTGTHWYGPFKATFCSGSYRVPALRMRVYNLKPRKMWRLRQAACTEAAQCYPKLQLQIRRAGLNAMRAVLAAATTPTKPDPMDEDDALPHKPKQAHRYTIERPGLLAGRGQ